MPSFNPLIPTVNDATLQSFFQLRANFQAINSTFAENHSALTKDPDNVGKHTTLTMQPQAGNPTTSATQLGLYNKLVTGIPELFFAPNNAQAIIQLTYQSLSVGLQSSDPDVYLPKQYTFMAGPFLVYAGTIGIPTLNQLVTLTPTSQLLYVGLTGTSVIVGSNAFLPTNINNVPSSFNVSFQVSPTSQSVFYVAIGLP